jgi:ATP-dependent DNA ligase
MPGFIEPQLATLKAKPPKGDDYLHEIKFDGYRVQLHMLRGKSKVYTRGGHDWTNRFKPIVNALDLDISAILDGEIVVVEDSRTNFSLLQADLASGARTAWRSTCSTSSFSMGETSGAPRYSNERKSWKASAGDCIRLCSTASTST